MATLALKQWSTLTMNTLAFTVNFAIWTMFSIIGIQIQQDLALSQSQFGLMVAIPILSGAISRLPLVLLSDYFGGRIISFLQMLFVAAACYALSFATVYWHYLLSGLLVGMAGGSFAIGITYTADWFEKEQNNLTMSVFSLGNLGAALTNIIAPIILLSYGWRMVPQAFGVALFITAILFLLFTFKDSAVEKNRRQIRNAHRSEQLKHFRELKVWRFALYYFFVFGGFVAITLWLPQYFMSEYGLTLQNACLATLVFTLPSTLVRSVGSLLSDSYNPRHVNWSVFWICIVCLFFLSYPPTTMNIHGITKEIQLELSVNVWFFTALIFVMGITMGFGKASIYRLIQDSYPDNMSVVGGFVGVVGGLGGFVLPVIFGLASDLTSIRSSCFMVLYGVLGMCMIWMYYAFKAEAHLERVRDAMKSHFLTQ